ncbi:MAG: serine/threonine-protein kinase [Polyangiaceae bacterium]
MKGPVLLGRYELLYPLGSGGMGTVWMARGRSAREAEKFFVVKTLRDEHSDDPEFRDMFFDEARIASGIDSVNVARIFDLGDESGIPYLVMEVVDGESLQRIHRDAKKSGELPPPQITLRIIADACAGLHAAHELRGISGELRDVIHRDISPHNILVGMNGVTKIIDFGIAKARDRVATKTKTGQVKGKLQYLAPEQAHGKSIDRRIDIWTTGSVLYLLLTGHAAYDGPHDAAILSAILFNESHTPLPDSVHPAVRAVVDHALERDPKKRFATADEMRIAIERALKKMGVSATTDDVAKYMNAHYRDDSDTRREDLASAVEVTTQRRRPRPAREVFYVETTLAMPTLVNDGAEKKAERRERKREHKPRSKISLPEIALPNEDTRRGIFLGVGVSLAAMVITFVVVSIVVARTRAPAARATTPSAASSP